MGDSSPTSITEEDAIALVLAEPRPVVFVDTCCLGDVFRGVLDGKIDNVRQLCLAIQNNSQKHFCYYVFSEQVKAEFCKPDQFVKREIDALSQPIKRWNNAVRACCDLGADVFQGIKTYPQFDMVWANDLYEDLRSYIAKMFSVGCVVTPSEKSRVWGSCREESRKRPAHQGKDSFGDCLICGSALNMTRMLRDGGFSHAAYFASSNVKDYMDSSREQLHPDLSEEFAGCKLTYCKSILQAYGSIMRGKSSRGVAGL